MAGSTRTKTATIVSKLRDQRDEHLARLRRTQLGFSLQLVSWYPLPDGRWLARFSGPDCLETTEHEGNTRCEAIQLAENAHRQAWYRYRQAEIETFEDES